MNSFGAIHSFHFIKNKKNGFSKTNISAGGIDSLYNINGRGNYLLMGANMYDTTYGFNPPPPFYVISTNGGATWTTNTSLSLESGMYLRGYISNNGNHLIFGIFQTGQASNAGVRCSSNGGTSYVSTTNSQIPVISQRIINGFVSDDGNVKVIALRNYINTYPSSIYLIRNLPSTNQFTTSNLVYNTPASSNAICSLFAGSSDDGRVLIFVCDAGSTNTNYSAISRNYGISGQWILLNTIITSLSKTVLIRTVAISGNGNYIIIATSNNFIWLSSNSGVSFSDITSNLPSMQNYKNTGSITWDSYVSKTGKYIIVVAFFNNPGTGTPYTTYNTYLFISSDYGSTWKSIVIPSSSSEFLGIRGVTMTHDSNENPNKIFISGSWTAYSQDIGTYSISLPDTIYSLSYPF
jgi:hypothetical protein